MKRDQESQHEETNNIIESLNSNSDIESSNLALRKNSTEKYADTPIAKIWKELLFNSVEYSALFKVHRPFQTDQIDIPQEKILLRLFSELTSDINHTKQEITECIEIQMNELKNEAESEIRTKLSLLYNNFVAEVDRCRRACRVKLANAIKIIVYEFNSERMKQIENARNAHNRMMTEIQSDIMEVKTATLKKKDEIAKLEKQFKKYQAAVKKNGLILEADKMISSSGDDKTVADVMNHYQQLIHSKDEKINPLKRQIQYFTNELKVRKSVLISLEAEIQAQKRYGATIEPKKQIPSVLRRLSINPEDNGYGLIGGSRRSSFVLTLQSQHNLNIRNENARSITDISGKKVKLHREDTGSNNSVNNEDELQKKLKDLKLDHQLDVKMEIREQKELRDKLKREFDREFRKSNAGFKNLMNTSSSKVLVQKAQVLVPSPGSMGNKITKNVELQCNLDVVDVDVKGDEFGFVIHEC